MSVDQIDIRFRPSRLSALLDAGATPLQGATDDETEILSVPVRLRRAGREIRMVIDGADPFAAKPDARLIKLLLRARRFNATLVDSEGIPAPSTCQAGVRRMQAIGSDIGDLLPTDAPDFRPDLECLGPKSSMLRSSNVIAAEVEEVIDLIVG